MILHEYHTLSIDHHYVLMAYQILYLLTLLRFVNLL